MSRVPTEQDSHEAHHSEEKGGLVGLQGGLRIKGVVPMALSLGGNHGGCTQFLDELEKVRGAGQTWRGIQGTFLRAL